MNYTERYLGCCKHFNGQSPTCEKGIRYSELERRKELGDWGAGLRRPCLLRNHDEKNRKGQPLSECEHLEFYSQEEAEVLGELMEAHVANFMVNLEKFVSGERRKCLNCERPVKYCKKIGRCCYAYPCGCRQYQGDAPTWTDGVTIRTTTRQI